MDRVMTQSPSPSPLFEALFDRLPVQAEVFSVTLPGGETLRFRYLRSRQALKAIRQAAHLFADSLTEVNCPEGLRGFLTSDFETLVWVYFLGYLCLDGEANDFLKMQHLFPVLFDQIVEEVQSALAGEIAAQESSHETSS